MHRYSHPPPRHPAQISHFWWGNDLAPSSVGVHGGWTTYKATWDGRTRKVFLDGRCVGTDSAQNKPHTVPANTPLVLGGLLREFGGESHLAFHGWISEVKISDHVRQQFFAGNHPPPRHVPHPQQMDRGGFAPPPNMNPLHPEGGNFFWRYYQLDNNEVTPRDAGGGNSARKPTSHLATFTSP